MWSCCSYLPPPMEILYSNHFRVSYQMGHCNFGMGDGGGYSRKCTLEGTREVFGLTHIYSFQYVSSMDNFYCRLYERKYLTCFINVLGKRVQCAVQGQVRLLATFADYMYSLIDSHFFILKQTAFMSPDGIDNGIMRDVLSTKGTVAIKFFQHFVFSLET